MTRSLIKLALLGLLTLGAWMGMWCYERQGGNPAKRKADAEAAAAAAEAGELAGLAKRLAAAPQRVAGLLVTDQSESNGAVRTTLLFQEYAGDGSTPPPRRFTLEGKTAHVEATVLQLQGPLAKGREALRGLGIPLFLRLYGDNEGAKGNAKEGAEAAAPIDEPGRVPAVYRGPEVTVSRFEQQLWRDFWHMAGDDAYRTRSGVRAARGRVDLNGLEMGRLYTLTLHPDASLTVTSEPLKEGYLEMLKRDEEKVGPRTGPGAAVGR